MYNRHRHQQRCAHIAILHSKLWLECNRGHRVARAEHLTMDKVLAHCEIENGGARTQGVPQPRSRRLRTGACTASRLYRVKRLERVKKPVQLQANLWGTYRDPGGCAHTSGSTFLSSWRRRSAGRRHSASLPSLPIHATQSVRLLRVCRAACTLLKSSSILRNAFFSIPLPGSSRPSMRGRRSTRSS